MKREDLLLEEEAKTKGWTVERHTLDVGEEIPQFPLTFKKERKVIWKTKRKWTCADIIPVAPNYINHRTHETLALALAAE